MLESGAFSQAIAAGKRPVTVDQGGGGDVSADDLVQIGVPPGLLSNVPPPAPSGFGALGAIGYNLVKFDWPTYGNHSHAEIWRAQADNFSNAVLIGITPSSTYQDPYDTPTTAYYWARFVSTAGKIGPYNDTAGTMARSYPLINGIKPGEIGKDLIAALDAAKIVGSLSDAQLAGISANKLIGTLTNAQVPGLAAVDSRVTSLSSRVGSAESAVTTLQTTTATIEGKVLGTWQVVISGTTPDGKKTLSGLQAYNDGVKSGFVITADQLLIQPSGSALNDDPNFLDRTAWAIQTGAPTFTPSGAGGAAVAPSYLVSTDVAWVYSVKGCPVDPNRTYRLSGHFFRDAANVRTAYLAVLFYDANGNAVSTTWGGAWSGYPWSGQPTAAGNWALSEGNFGAGTTRAIPANAKRMHVGVILNYGTGTAGQMAAQNVRLEEVLGATLIKNGAITTNHIMANAVKATHVDTYDLVTNSAVVGQLVANSGFITSLTSSTAFVDALTANTAYINTLTAKAAFIAAVRTNVLTASSVTAEMIDSRGLSIKDAAGNVIVGLNTPIPVDAAAVLGFNPQFSAWSGAYPDGWTTWAGAAPGKETASVRTGPYAVRWVSNGGNIGMLRSATWAQAPLPAGTFLQGSFDINIINNNGGPGRPLYLIRLYTTSAAPNGVYRDTYAPVTDKTVGGWRRETFSARVQPGERIYGITVFQMASWDGFEGGWASGSTCIFDNLTFEWRDASTDNTQQQWTDVQQRPADDAIKNNLIDLGWWKRDASIPWTQNAEYNRIAACSPSASGADLNTTPGPKGGNDLVWYAQETNNNGQSGGGWDSPSFGLDPTKTHRFVVPIRILSAHTQGQMYWGTNGVCTLNTTTTIGNPYFAVMPRASMSTDRWYLFVGYIYPNGSGGSTHESAGVWDCKTGKKVQGGTNYNHNNGWVLHRAYQYYAAQDSSAAFGRPMINVVDGTEPALREYFEGATLGVNVDGQIDAGNRPGLVSNTAFSALGMTFDPDLGLIIHKRGDPTKRYLTAKWDSAPWLQTLSNTAPANGELLVQEPSDQDVLDNRRFIRALVAAGSVDLSTTGGGSAVEVRGLGSEIDHVGLHSERPLTTILANIAGFNVQLEPNSLYYVSGVVPVYTGNQNYGLKLAVTLPAGCTINYSSETASTSGAYAYQANRYVNTVAGTQYLIWANSTVYSNTLDCPHRFEMIIATGANGGALQLLAGMWAGTGTMRIGAMMRQSKLRKTLAVTPGVAAAPWGLANIHTSDTVTTGNIGGGQVRINVMPDGVISITGDAVASNYWATTAPSAGIGGGCEVQFVVGAISKSSNTDPYVTNGAAGWTVISAARSLVFSASTHGDDYHEAYGSASVDVTVNLRVIGGATVSKTFTLRVYNTVNFNDL